jgi:hypothetical protein
MTFESDYKSQVSYYSKLECLSRTLTSTAVADTLTYYDTELISALKGFITITPGSLTVKLFKAVNRSKLDRLPLSLEW